MGKLTVAGDLILLAQIEDDAELRRRLAALRPGETIDLDVDGITGRWQRTADLNHPGYRPTGTMHEAWSQLQAVPGRTVNVRPMAPNDAGLATFGDRLRLWDTPDAQIR